MLEFGIGLVLILLGESMAAVFWVLALGGGRVIAIGDEGPAAFLLVTMIVIRIIRKDMAGPETGK